MTRFRLGLLLLLSSWSAQAGDETRSSTSFSLPPGRGCPVVCAPYEACIEQRCVETCRPGCRPGAYCSASGECLSIPSTDEPLLTEAEQAMLAGAESRDSRTFVFVDLGGIVGLGAKLGFEKGMQHALLARFTLMNTGIMTHALFADNQSLRFEWGFGASVGYRHYEARWGNLRGFYYGGGVDYSVMRVVDKLDTRVGQTHSSVAPYGEFGYRWVFGVFAIGFGPSLALRYPLGRGFLPGSAPSCPTPESCTESRRRGVEGTLGVEIGWFQ